MSPVIICIDGNIGVGKSTLLNELGKRGYTIIKEDLDSWRWCLDNYYSNQHRWSFTLQMSILQSMALQYQRINTMNDRIVFIERSPESGMIFTANSLNNGSMSIEEYNVVKSFYSLFGWNAHVTFLLKTSVEKCMERIKNRNRECESCITPEYISKLNIEYSKLRAIKMDSDVDVCQLANDIEMFCNVFVMYS
jgi:deoxyadenosine/deoxycytidine kinase